MMNELSSSSVLLLLQRRLPLDQPAGGGGGAGGLRTGGPRPGSHGDQGGAGGALPDRGRGGGGGHRRHPHQLPWREAAHAPARRLPGRPVGPHLRGLQHVAPPSGRHGRWMKDYLGRCKDILLLRLKRIKTGAPRQFVARREEAVHFFCPEFRLSGSAYSQAYVLLATSCQNQVVIFRFRRGSYSA